MAKIFWVQEYNDRVSVYLYPDMSFSILFGNQTLQTQENRIIWKKPLLLPLMYVSPFVFSSRKKHTSVLYKT